MIKSLSIRARPEMIELFAERNKCFMCRHKFDKPMLLEVERPGRGKLQPNYNAEYFFHLYDTHGLSPSIVKDWVFGSIYGLKLTEMGYKI